jgi:hypothetical protein
MAFPTLQQLVNDVQSAVTDTSPKKFTVIEIIRLLDRAWKEFADEGEFNEATQSTDLVAGTAGYTLATDLAKIIRVTAYGFRCPALDERQLAVLNMDGQSVTAQSKRCYYTVWGTTITLIPIPSTTTASALKIYYWKIPADLTIAAIGTDLQTLGIPPEYNGALVDYAIGECFRWIGDRRADFYTARWESAKSKAKEATVKKRDRFAVVKDDESSLYDEFGVV